jgi:DNA-binding transcriptional regulator WhiA
MVASRNKGIKMSKIKMKTMNLPCECVGKEETCGYLRIIKIMDGFEFCWVKNRKQKKSKIGVYIKNIKKIKDFLEKV